MKWITLITVTCLLLVGVCSCTASTENKQEMYQYYMQLAYQYEIAAITEETQAEYYANMAQGLKTGFTGMEEQQYEELMLLSTNSRENAKKYREAADRYKSRARQYE